MFKTVLTVIVLALISVVWVLPYFGITLPIDIDLSFLEALENPFFLVPALLGLTLIWWIYKSIKVIPPTEMAIWIFLGEAKSVLDSGLVFVPYLGSQSSLAIYPKKMYKFDYESMEVITKAGPVDGRVYHSQVLKIDATVYLNFPRDHNTEVDDTHPLIKILRTGVPTKDEDLKKWTSDAIASAVRSAMSKMTWKEAIEDKSVLQENIESILKGDDKKTEEGLDASDQTPKGSDNNCPAKKAGEDDDESAEPLRKAGFRSKGIKLVVKDIKLPEQISSIMPKPDVQIVELESVTNEASIQAIKVSRSIIEAMAQSRGISVEEMQGLVGQDVKMQEEFTIFFKDMFFRSLANEKENLRDYRISVDGMGEIGKMISGIPALFSMMGTNKDSSSNSKTIGDNKGKGERRTMPKENTRKNQDNESSLGENGEFSEK